MVAGHALFSTDTMNEHISRAKAWALTGGLLFGLLFGIGFGSHSGGFHGVVASLIGCVLGYALGALCYCGSTLLAWALKMKQS